MFHRAQEHPQGYTLLDNGILRNKGLSLKARGLMATILSEPDDWDFSVRGFAAILPDKRTAIEGAVKELERAGHIRRLPQGRGPNGRMLPGEWDIYERPGCDGSVARNQQPEATCGDEEAQVETDGGFSACGEQAEFNT